MHAPSAAWDAAIAAFAVAQLGVNVARSSVITRRQHLRHAAPRLGVDPWAVTTDDVLAYMAQANWERETRRSRRTTLASFYRWAVATGRTASDPMENVDRIRPGTPNPRPVPDRVYLEALVRADEDESLWIDLAAEHGLRRAEIAVIHADDIVETLIGHDLVVHGKGSKLREVPLTTAMSAKLRERAERLGGGYLFPGDDAGHVSPRWLGTRVSRLLPGDWTIHKLWHRAATRFWIAAEGDPYVVADLMGWASLNMVRTYVKLPDGRKRAVLERASRGLSRA